MVGAHEGAVGHLAVGEATRGHLHHHALRRLGEEEDHPTEAARAPGHALGHGIFEHGEGLVAARRALGHQTQQVGAVEGAVVQLVVGDGRAGVVAAGESAVAVEVGVAQGADVARGEVAAPVVPETDKGVLHGGDQVAVLVQQRHALARRRAGDEGRRAAARLVPEAGAEGVEGQQVGGVHARGRRHGLGLIQPGRRDAFQARRKPLGALLQLAAAHGRAPGHLVHERETSAQRVGRQAAVQAARLGRIARNEDQLTHGADSTRAGWGSQARQLTEVGL